MINAVGLSGGHLVRFGLARRHLPGLRIALRLASRATVKEISGYSAWLFVLDVAQRMFYNADAVVIAALLPVAAVTDFNLGFRAASSVSYLSGPAIAVLLPAAAAWEARAAAQELARVLAAATRLACAVTIPAVLWLTLWGHQVIHVWLGSKHGDAVNVLWVFLPVFLVGATQNAAATILRGTGHVRALAVTVGVEYSANLGLSVILVPHLGAMGAAVGTLVPAVVVGLGVIPLLACRALGLPYAKYVVRPIAAPVLVAVPVAGALTLLHGVLSTASIGVIAVSGASSLIIYAGIFWWFAAGSEEQSLIRLMWARLGQAVGKDGRGSRAQHCDSDPEPSGISLTDPGEFGPTDGGPWVV